MPKGGVILVSDKEARLRPCLRCGYSLRHILGARNCPECGLAVRISLSENTGLEWTNPRWQRFMAMGLGVLALGMVLRLLRYAANWLIYGDMAGYFKLGATAIRGMLWLWIYAREASPIICGLALCMLAKRELRCPDRSRVARRLTLGVGTLVVTLGLLDALTRLMNWWSPAVRLLYRAINGPWVPLAISILVCSWTLDIGRRGRSRRLRQMSQVPLWPLTAGLVVWALSFDRIFFPISPLLFDALFPLTMVVMLAVAVRVLLRGAREAELNWITDL
jgi:hypothetical protein